MKFEKSCKTLGLSSILLSASLFSQNSLANSFDSGFNENLECYDGMSIFQCEKEIKKSKKRALSYFKSFVVYKAVEESLDHYGLLPGVKSLVHKIDDLRTFETTHGTYYFNGTSLRVKDLYGIKNSYFDVKLDFDNGIGLDGFKINYSVRF